MRPATHWLSNDSIYGRLRCASKTLSTRFVSKSRPHHCVMYGNGKYLIALTLYFLYGFDNFNNI